MTSYATTNRLPWHDRWSQPSLDGLLDALKAHHRRIFDHCIETLDQWDRVKQTLIWYGPSWKWTMEYRFTPGRGREPDNFCYLVPNHEAPLICVPLSDEQIEKLPIKRLNRVIRDGIRASKCAVSIHWATWTPSNLSETGHLIDLLKRKHKMLLGDDKQN